MSILRNQERRRFMKKRKSKTRGNPIFLIIGIIFLLISVGLGIYLIIQNNEYNAQMEAVDDVKNLVVSTIPSETGIPSDITDVTTGADGDGSVATEPEDVVPERTYIDANFLRKVDFGALQAINSDATRWFYIPDTTIDSYVMQEQTVGEYYYLWKDIYKKYSNSGSLLTPKIPLDMPDAHLLIFGHRISSRSDVAFSSLRNYYATAESASAYPYVYLYYPDRVERWRVWAVSDMNASDSVYSMPYELGSDAYASMLADVGAKARYELCDGPDALTNTLFLSTCNGTRSGSDVRLVVACVPDAVYYYETNEVVPFGHADSMT